MFLFFDTETTNIPSASRAPNHPEQCRIMQLGFLVCDEKLNIINTFCSLIDIDNTIQISSGAQACHGITKEQCKAFGIPMQVALASIDYFYHNCILVGHNIKFDKAAIAIELQNLNIKQNGYIPKPEFCTMLRMTDICKLPGNYGKFKWPKLEEAFRHCYPTTPAKVGHNSLNDCFMTRDIFKWLLENKHIVL